MSAHFFRPFQRIPHRFYLMIIAVLLTGFLSFLAIATAISCYLTLQHYALVVQQRNRQDIEQIHWAILDRAEAFKFATNYPSCVKELHKIPEDSKFYSRGQQLLNECYAPLAQNWLNDAKNLAQEGKLEEAIDAALNISGGSLHAQAQQHITIWSDQILDIAEQHYFSSSNQLNQAIAIARAIPEGSPLYIQSQETIKTWQQQWSIDQQHWNAARVALDTGDLETAHQQAKQISEHPFWSVSRDEILVKIQTQEQLYEQLWQKIQQHVVQGDLHSAVQLTQKLPDFEPWAARKLDIFQQTNSIANQRRWTAHFMAGILVIGVVILLKSCVST